MILNARQNGFYLDLPIDFFSPEISKKYEKYYSSLVLPYPTIFDFMSSTIQAVNFPGFDSTLLTQTRPYGKKQDIQSSIPIEDQFSKRLEITFKLTDAYLNYFIFLDSALQYLDREATDPENTQNSLGTASSFSPKPEVNHPYFNPMRLTLLNNEGYGVASIIINRPMLTKISDFHLSYSSISPQITTFSTVFNYFNFDLELEF